MPPLRGISNFPAAPPPSSQQQDSAHDTEGDVNVTSNTSSVVIVAPNMLPALSPHSSVGLGITSPPLQQTQPSPTSGSPASSDATPQPPPQPSIHQLAQTEVPTTVAGTPSQQGHDYFGPLASGAVPAQITPEDPSGASSTGAAGGTSHGGGPAGLSTPGGLMGKLRGLGRTTKRPQGESVPGTPAPQLRTPGAAATPAVPAVPVANASTHHETSARQQQQEAAAKPRTAAQAVLASGSLTPPTSADAPALSLAPDIPLLIAEERAHGWAVVYRGTVSSAGTIDDVETLEDAMPVWLLEYLLLGRAPQVSVVKIGFVLLPLQSGVPGDEVLPELVNT